MKKRCLFISLLLLITNVYTQTISPFILPLPEKYKNTSSCQELREIIEIEETGASTSGLWHNGLDFPCPDKTEVYAAKDGKVVCVYPGYYNGEKFKGHPSYGGLIIIKHFDGTITLYAHLSCTFVTEETYIKQGQKIALSGGVKGRRGSGTSTGPHLHFAIYMDIKQWLKLQ